VQKTFLLGVLLQLPVALVVLALARLLLRAASSLGRALAASLSSGSGREPHAALEAVQSPGPFFAAGHPVRGPPPALLV
jgi:hypothetical protein